jgi:hypothetical protein
MDAFIVGNGQAIYDIIPFCSLKIIFFSPLALTLEHRADFSVS